MNPNEPGTSGAEPTPEQTALYADMEARKKWERNESGVDVFPEAPP